MKRIILMAIMLLTFSFVNAQIVKTKNSNGNPVAYVDGITLRSKNSIGDAIFYKDGNTIRRKNYNGDAFYKILEGYDIVTVSPKENDKLSSKLFYKTYNFFSKSKYKLRTDRFRILSRRAINRAFSISATIPYRKAMYINSGLKIFKELFGYHSETFIANNFIWSRSLEKTLAEEGVNYLQGMNCRSGPPHCQHKTRYNNFAVSET
jgi:hypothetical protein